MFLGVGVGGGLQAKHLLPCCCIRDSLLSDMQDKHVLRKLNFDPNFRVRGNVVGGGLRQNTCYHAAALVIPFDLICNITMF